MRVTLLVLIVLVFALAVAIAYKTLIGKTASDSGTRGPQPAWADRVTPVVHPAPGPLPKGSVLVGVEEDDTDGYPRQHVDQRALRSLLWHGRHDELNRYLEKLQSAFEKNWPRELWPRDAGDAFASAEPAMGERLDPSTPEAVCRVRRRLPRRDPAPPH